MMNVLVTSTKSTERKPRKSIHQVSPPFHVPSSFPVPKVLAISLYSTQQTPIHLILLTSCWRFVVSIERETKRFRCVRPYGVGKNRSSRSVRGNFSTEFYVDLHRKRTKVDPAGSPPPSFFIDHLVQSIKKLLFLPKYHHGSKRIRKRKELGSRNSEACPQGQAEPQKGCKLNGNTRRKGDLRVDSATPKSLYLSRCLGLFPRQ